MLKTNPKISAFIFCLFLLVSLSQGTKSAEHAPDTVYLNGRIYTVDEERRWVEALAVTGREISALGSNAIVAALAGPRTRTIDLAGQMFWNDFAAL